MSLIVMMTDFGLKDNFVGIMKGVILGINPSAGIADLCHDVAMGNISEAAFLLKHSIKYFPRGTIFLVVVDPGVGSARKPILVKTGDQYFVGPDNGVMSMACSGKRMIVNITNKKYFLKSISDTFHGRDIFAPVAAYLSLGKDIRTFGTKIKSMKTVRMPAVKKNDRLLIGRVMHVDRFGNLITNIYRKEFMKFIRGRGYFIELEDIRLSSISKSYGGSKPVAVFNSFDLLEFALPGGGLASCFRQSSELNVKVNIR